MLVPLSGDAGSPRADAGAITADATLIALNAPPPRRLSADRALPTADAESPTVDADLADRLGGFLCARLPDGAPSVADRQSSATADDLYPQIAGVLTPRGPAWGTDEAGDGRGAGPVMRGVWRALAAWVARQNADEWTLATQALPSAVTYSLPDWEAELGLPDPCAPAPVGQAARLSAVRARFAATGGASPAYFVCLAAAAGFAITIEEPTQFICDVSEVSGSAIAEDWFRIDEGEIGATPLEGFRLLAAADDTDELGLPAFLDGFFVCDEGVCDDTPLEGDVPNAHGNAWQTWIAHVPALGDTFFTCDEGEINADPLEGFLTADVLECVLRRAAPAHTELLIAYDG